MSCLYCFNTIPLNKFTSSTLILKDLLKLKMDLQQYDPLNIFANINSHSHQELLYESISSNQPTEQIMN
jgi:hypothetical protein